MSVKGTLWFWSVGRGRAEFSIHLWSHSWGLGRYLDLCVFGIDLPSICVKKCRP